MYTQCVLALLVLYVGSAHSFSWDIVLGCLHGLSFYNDGKLTHSEHMSTAIHSINYDPVHNRVFFYGGSHSPGIYSYDIATKKIQHVVSCESNRSAFQFTYDPVTETLFWILENTKLYSTQSKHGSTDTVSGDFLFHLDESFHLDITIAVDSLGRYIYWSTQYNIQRARFDGSEREVVIDSHVYSRMDLAIDQTTQKLYWIDEHRIDDNPPDYYITIESADLKGTNRTLYTKALDCYSGFITVSNDFVYWGGGDRRYDRFWRIPKNPPQQFNLTTYTNVSSLCLDIAANYKLEDQTQESTTDVSLLCVHGTKAIGESVCKCTQGYTGERCDVFICQNYCFQGNCSVIDEQPECRCNAGYSGLRCEVDVCQGYCLNNGVCSLNAENQPVCQCAGDYKGKRCDVSVCQDYCFQGNCSVSDQGLPKCRCNAGYSGERCSDVDACHMRCLNNGTCVLNEMRQPVCQCPEDYEGERCEVSVSVFLMKCFRVAPTLSALRDILNTDVAPVTLDKGVLQLLTENNGASILDEP